MRISLAIFLLALLAVAEDRVRVEIVTPRARYFVGEPIRVRLQVDYDAGYFESNAVQLFQRELDVPLQVRADWLDSPASASGPTIALNDSVVPVRSDEPGKLVIEQTLLAREPGELVLSGPRVRYAYATEFREDFIQGRMPVDRHEVSVEGDARVLEIAPLPERGRPEGFGGALGRSFSIRSTANPRILVVGAIVKLELTVEGEGNLGEFEAPRLDDLDGFHVYGAVERSEPNRRVITYDLAPIDGNVSELPAIRFAYFDCEAAEYRTLETEPIPLSVRGENPAELEPAEADNSPGWVLLWTGLAVIVCLWLWKRGRRAPVADPAEVFRARDDVPDAFVGYLAARLDCPTAAVISPGLTDRLVQAGVSPVLARQTAALVEELVAARYGGGESDDRTERARALVEALEVSGAFPA